jgi:general secretion pathway protein D
VKTTLALVLLLWGTLAQPVLLPAQDPSGVQTTPQGVLVDFQDADLRLVLSALAEAGALNVVFSEIPPRRITLRMGRALPRESLLPLLRSIADANGLRVVEEAGFLRVEAVAMPVAQDPRAAAGAAAETRLFVYRLRHVRADRLAATLQSVFGGARPAAAPGLSRAPLSERLREQRIPPFTADTARPPAPAQALAELPGELGGEIQIVADETTNSLLVRAQPADWEVVQQAIQALDLRPLQVLIEVLIAEVRRTNDVELGVTARGSNRGTDDPANQIAGVLRTTGEFIFEILQLGGADLDVVISALAESGQFRILSRPVVLAQNNEEARILVGSQRPFVQVIRALPTDAAVRDQVVQYRDVGTSLHIKPTINPDGYVNLQVVQEVSSATTEIQFGAPVISTREAATYLFVRDGQTAVIGGLMERQRDLTRSGIPLLMDIPLLGLLFGSTRSEITQAELFIFLTPRIIYADEDTDRVREGVEQSSPLLRRVLPQPPLVPPGTSRLPEEPR